MVGRDAAGATPAAVVLGLPLRISGPARQQHSVGGFVAALCPFAPAAKALTETWVPLAEAVGSAR